MAASYTAAISLSTPAPPQEEEEEEGLYLRTETRKRVQTNEAKSKRRKRRRRRALFAKEEGGGVRLIKDLKRKACTKPTRFVPRGRYGYLLPVDKLL